MKDKEIKKIDDEGPSETRETKVKGDVFKNGEIITTVNIKDKIDGAPYFNTIINRSTIKAFETFYILDSKKTPEQIKNILANKMFGNYTIEDNYSVSNRNWVGFYITPKYQDRIVASYTMHQKNQSEYEYAFRFAPTICEKLKCNMIFVARELYSKHARVVFFDAKGNKGEELQFQDSHECSRVMMERYKISINDQYMNLMNRINAEQHRISYMNGGIKIKQFSQERMKGVSYEQFKFYFKDQEPQDGKVIEQFWFDPFQLSPGTSATWARQDGSASNNNLTSDMKRLGIPNLDKIKSIIRGRSGRRIGK